MDDGYKEIETRFLDIDVEDLERRLGKLGATNKGEAFLKETIFLDRNGNWENDFKVVRLRVFSGGKVKLSYKRFVSHDIDGTREIELSLDENPKKISQFLEAIDLVVYRYQEKKRHTYELEGVTVDIDTWPSIPTYVELEGESEEALKGVAEKLGLDWSEAVFKDAQAIIEMYIKKSFNDIKYFTFDRIE